MRRTLLHITAIVRLIAALLGRPYSAGWGYYPSGLLEHILLMVISLSADPAYFEILLVGGTLRRHSDGTSPQN